MITISDCEAFCDADPGWVRELARREGLGMVQAYAEAHINAWDVAAGLLSPPPPLLPPLLPLRRQQLGGGGRPTFSAPRPPNWRSSRAGSPKRRWGCGRGRLGRRRCAA